MSGNQTTAPPLGIIDQPVIAKSSLTQQWYLDGVLTLIYVLNYIDRGALNLIVNPLKDDLHITDVQISLLIGLSFAALYELPLHSRPATPRRHHEPPRAARQRDLLLVVHGCAAVVFAGNYGQLFTGRVGLGVGEAALPPTAYSLLRDGVRPEHRARAFSCYHLGTGVFTALGANDRRQSLRVGTRPWRFRRYVPVLQCRRSSRGSS